MAKATKTSTGRWHIQIQIAGVRDSGTFATKREADSWAQERAVELRAAKAGKSGTVKTLRDALREYAERVTPGKRGWVKELVRLKAFEGPGHHALPVNKRLSDVTSGDVALWRDARLKVNARGTVLRDLTLLSAVLEIARKEWGWVDANVCRDVTRPANPDHREVIIHGPQIRRMLRQLGWSRKPARSVSQAIANCFLLALQTGARAGELCAMRWADVKPDQVAITGKTGKRNLPLTPASRRTIELMRGFDDELVFGIKSQSLDALFRRARERAGLSGFVMHDARHTAATRLAQRLHVLDLCLVFGWQNTSRALVYYNPTASQIAKRIAAGSRA